MAEIRKNVETLEKGAGAFSFHFTNIWPHKDASDLAVYFEKTNENGADITRRAFAAQYSVDAKTCTPKFRKMQALFIDQENPSGLETASPVPEHCNEASVIPTLHTEIEASMKDLVSHAMDGAQASNFIYQEFGAWQAAVTWPCILKAFARALRQFLGWPSSPWIPSLVSRR